MTMSRTLVALNILLSATAIGVAAWALVQTHKIAGADRVITARGLIMIDSGGVVRFSQPEPQ